MQQGLVVQVTRRIRAAPTRHSSFAPLLDRPAQPWKRAVFSEYLRPGKEGRLGVSMRTERYRFTRWVRPDDRARADGLELYDHERDPQENDNIAADPEHAALVAQLTAQSLAGWRTSLPNAAAPPERSLFAYLQRQLAETEPRLQIPTDRRAVPEWRQKVARRLPELLGVEHSVPAPLAPRRIATHLAMATGSSTSPSRAKTAAKCPRMCSSPTAPRPRIAGPRCSACKA